MEASSTDLFRQRQQRDVLPSEEVSPEVPHNESVREHVGGLDCEHRDVPGQDDPLLPGSCQGKCSTKT